METEERATLYRSMQHYAMETGNVVRCIITEPDGHIVQEMEFHSRESVRNEFYRKVFLDQECHFKKFV